MRKLIKSCRDKATFEFASNDRECMRNKKGKYCLDVNAFFIDNNFLIPPPTLLCRT